MLRYKVDESKFTILSNWRIMLSLNCEKCSHGILRTPGREKELRNLITFTHYYKGELIIQQGEAILGYHTLCQGYVKLVKRNKEGKSRLLQILEPGNLIDVCSLFTEVETYSFHVQSMTETQIGFILKKELSSWFESHPPVAKKVIGSIANQLDIQFKRAIWDAWEGSRKRLIRALLFLEGGNQILSTKPPQLSQKELAIALGITRETLSRHLHWLQSKEVVNLEKGNIQVVDANRLKQLLTKI